MNTSYIKVLLTVAAALLGSITVESRPSGVSASDSDDLRSLFEDMREEFATLKAENIKTNKKLNQLMVENDQLKSQQHKSEHKIEELINENELIKSQQHKSEHKIEELIKENVLIKSQQHKSDNEITLVKMENADMRLAIEEIKQDKYMYQMKPQEFKMIGVDENNTQYEKEHSTGVVAFLARIAAFTGSLTEETIIPFDTVDLNIGDSYDPLTGEFSPPVSGIYHISHQAMADGSCGDGEIAVKLQVNGVDKSEAHSELYSSAASSVSLQLAAGDTVTVVTDYTQACQSLQNNNLINKFSAHLVYQII